MKFSKKVKIIEGPKANPSPLGYKKINIKNKSGSFVFYVIRSFSKKQLCFDLVDKTLPHSLCDTMILPKGNNIGRMLTFDNKEWVAVFKSLIAAFLSFASTSKPLNSGVARFVFNYSVKLVRGSRLMWYPIWHPHLNIHSSSELHDIKGTLNVKAFDEQLELKNGYLAAKILSDIIIENSTVDGNAFIEATDAGIPEVIISIPDVYKYINGDMFLSALNKLFSTDGKPGLVKTIGNGNKLQLNGYAYCLNLYYKNSTLAKSELRVMPKTLSQIGGAGLFALDEYGIFNILRGKYFLSPEKLQVRKNFQESLSKYIDAEVKQLEQ